MSIRAMSAVWDCSTFDDPSALLVLLALADHADARGECWPSVESLVHKSRSSRRTVQRTIADAEDRGELIRVVNAGPKGTNVYRFTLPGAVDNMSTGGATVAPLPGIGAPQTTGGGATPRLGGGATGGARIIKNRQEPSRARAHARPTDVTSPADTPTPDPVEVAAQVAAVRLRAGLTGRRADK